MIRAHANGDKDEITFKDFAAIFGQFDGLEFIKADSE